ncbi:YfiT family bacillithiol transferase [Neobacillus soli]|uniref:YfiT family bacillithiol transferase n=1 Tax=Neobacillus soli TaxID=220688 RepID=UPI000825FC28|nr:bacillithiol transferase BstA [Neobacillus soli]
MEDERYPIGQFQCPKVVSKENVQGWIEELKTFPQKLKESVENLDDKVLSYTYRENSWTIRQLVHHLVDSHMNSYIRFKLALTEDQPTIKPYQEDKWAELVDSTMPIMVSLTLLESLHKRWTCLLETLTDEQLKRTFIHPESGAVSLEKNIGIYAWHGNHHLAHIHQALKRAGDFS